MQTFTQIAARPFAAGSKVKQQTKIASSVRPASRAPIPIAALKRDDDKRKINTAAAIALAAVVPFASCCVGANNKAVASVYAVANTPSEAVSSTATKPPFEPAALGDESGFDKLKKWTGEEQPGKNLGDSFSKLKVPGLPSGGELLENAPNVPTPSLPTMPNASEAIPNAGRNW